MTHQLAKTPIISVVSGTSLLKMGDIVICRVGAFKLCPLELVLRVRFPSGGVTATGDLCPDIVNAMVRVEGELCLPSMLLGTGVPMMTTSVLLTIQGCLTPSVLDPEEKACTEMVSGSRMSSWELVSL